MNIHDLNREAEEILLETVEGECDDPVVVARRFVDIIRDHSAFFQELPKSKQLPMGGINVRITPHARQRMSDRIPGCNVDRVKILEKAARAVDRSFSPREIRRISMGGYRWVFGENDGELVLITVMK